MSQEFYRLKRLPPYLFAEVNGMKARARTAGEDIIDLGMGNPDTPTPRHIVDKLIEAVQNPRTHRYSSSRGIPGLRKAIAAYYQRRFGVKIDPEREAVVTLGSKEGLVNLAQAITEPGDVILVPSPTYPIHEFGFIISGAAIRHIPMTGPMTGPMVGGPTRLGVSDPHTEFLRGIERAVKHSIPRPLAVVLSYPSNPTAMTVGLDFYTEVVQLAKKLDLIILSDLAYAEIYFDDNPPPSVLQVPGAIDITVEFTSLSKT
ncbi:MAG: aminotransferase class I/II-fold pyridoxal phosphate-dependent enzyme, partial [Alphaproteobacteria bacterium]